VFFVLLAGRFDFLGEELSVRSDLDFHFLAVFDPFGLVESISAPPDLLEFLDLAVACLLQDSCLHGRGNLFKCDGSFPLFLFFFARPRPGERGCQCCNPQDHDRHPAVPDPLESARAAIPR